VSSRPTVAVNLLWCVPGEVGGSEEYLVRQLLGLAEMDADRLYDLTVYAPEGFAVAHPEVAAAHRLVTAPFDGRSRPRRIWGELTWLARRVAASDLVHHGGGTVPGRGGRRVLLTVHDLQVHTYPEHFTRLKRTYLGWSLPRSCRRASLVAVPSAYVRGTVIDHYGIDPERVVVVPHGVEPALGVEPTPPEVLRTRYRLGGGPIVVYPAVTHPHKNHRFLLTLMAERWTDPDLRLVLTGGRGAAEDDVAASVATLGLGDRVVRPGRVPAADRDGLVAMAEALVFPSGYEGFGAPVIEAMALGTPVIASDRAALPEVVGDAGLVLPLEIDAWASALDEVTRRRAELVAAGRRRVGAFTSARSGAALLDAYGLALA
jgi:alpha-1,3-rhamnosyl/mannosyltransferase